MFVAFVILPLIFEHQHMRENCGSERGNRQENDKNRTCYYYRVPSKLRYASEQVRSGVSNIKYCSTAPTAYCNR